MKVKFRIPSLVASCFLVGTLMLTAYTGRKRQLQTITPGLHNSKFKMSEEPDKISSGSSFEERTNETIHITTIVCGRGGDTIHREEGAVLIKSAIISAILNKVQRLAFHLFLEHMEDSTFFMNKLQEFGYPFKDVEVQILFYSVVNYMPKEQRHMLFTLWYRCSNAKLYLPVMLSQLDAVIYLDTDFIITGNVAKLWAQFDEMNDTQAIGVAPDAEPESRHFSEFFAKIPYPPPKGLNSGLVLMNLTRIRTSMFSDGKWQQTIQMLNDKFQKITRTPLVDQQLLNIFLYHYPNLLKVVPCQFNFCTRHCGFLCKAAEEDPYGIQALHGSYYDFEGKESNKQRVGAFRGIFLTYKNLNLTRANLDFKRDLMEPIRLMKTLPKGANSSTEPNLYYCIGSIDKVLYKNYFV